MAMENVSLKIKNGFKNNVGYIGTFVAIIIMLASRLMNFNGATLDVTQIVVSTIIYLIVGILVNISMFQQGAIAGFRDEMLKNTFVLYSDTAEKVSDKLVNLNAWCDKLNESELKKKRCILLNNVRVPYEDVFDETGYSKKDVFLSIPKKASKETKEYLRGANKGIKKAITLKIPKISPEVLLTNGNESIEKFDFGLSRTALYEKNIKSTFISKFGIYAVTGIISANLYLSFNLNGLLEGLFNALLLLLLGGLPSYIKSLTYITDTYKEGIKKKIHFMELYLAQDKINNSLVEKRQGE
jgi:hypothetical protein